MRDLESRPYVPQILSGTQLAAVLYRKKGLLIKEAQSQETKSTCAKREKMRTVLLCVMIIDLKGISPKGSLKQGYYDP